MARDPALSDSEMLNRLVHALAYARTGAPPTCELDEWRLQREARQQVRSLRADGLIG